jgi:formate hydrogenlyase subunit 3/multisubunit Na+/H+ antiporter MnhD subunit
MNLMGGLAKRMPRTATFFLVGAAATCALPPTNGFISEFLIYLGLFHGVIGPHGTFPAMAAPALASIGALAVAAMVGAYGTVFLGAARSERTAHAQESPASMWVPMLLTAAACLVLGLAPKLVVPMLQQAATVAAPELATAESATLTAIVPLDALTFVLWILFVLLIFGGLMLRHRMTQVEVRGGATWGCGYAAPTPRMQYTPTSLSQMLMSLFGWALQPRERRPVIRELFPQEAAYEVQVDDVVLDRALQPAASKAADRLLWFRWMQQGSSQAYLAYVFVILVVLFLWR